MKKILIIGPFPPPYHGTSVPNKYLLDYLKIQPNISVEVINTESGDKSNIKIFHYKIVQTFVIIFIKYIFNLIKCNTVFIIGSQRFIATAGAIFIIISKIVRREVYIYIHGGSFDLYLKNHNKLLRTVILYITKHATKIFVQTRIVYNYLNNYINNIQLIPNWIDYYALQKGIIQKTNYNTVKLYYAGEIRIEKGIIELLEAFKGAYGELNDEGIIIELFIYGKVHEEIAHVIKEMRHSSIFYGGYIPHDELIKRIREHDILVFPTYWRSEGYPGIMLESMALEKAIITTNWRAIPEVIENNKNGIVIECKNVPQLQKKIIELVKNEMLRSHLSKNAKCSAKKYDKNRILLEIYKQLIQK